LVPWWILTGVGVLHGGGRWHARPLGCTVAAGPYRWVRNPIYLAALLVVLGEAWLFCL
jgi:protein-S-isoprenylcysteine O-methyltransferase Ste14